MRPGEANFWTSDAQIPAAYSPGRPHFIQWPLTFSSQVLKLYYYSLNQQMHTIVLDLRFMGPCIANIFQYISKNVQHYTVYLYLETSLYVSGVTSTHHQEHRQLYLQHLVFVTPLLLPAAIVDELELV